MTYLTHGFRVSLVSDARERVRDLASPLCFMLRRSSLVECVSVLHGTCLQCAEKKYIHQYVKPCEENPRYTFLTIKSSLCARLCKLQKRVHSTQGIKFTSCLPMVDGSLWVLRLLPPLKLVAMINQSLNIGLLNVIFWLHSPTTIVLLYNDIIFIYRLFP
jgi:hypothetical protein